ncbi:MAG: 50S ribosomal protein L35 [Candidatus Yanofskybacteria bacterium]|nr:50S ribosomal protein L35 [Candidatus Yanofskybacteria bacterium]
MKTKKALMKRIKITGRGKILKRLAHQNHFNAKESGNATRGKRGSKLVPTELDRTAKQLIPQL